MIFWGIAASAATATTSAGIQIMITSEDNKTAVLGFSSNSISVKDAANQTLNQGIDYSLNASGGNYTITGLVIKQTYHITFASSNGSSMTVAVPITAFSATNKVVKSIFVDSSNFDIKKVGVIGGLVVESNGAAMNSVTVRAISGTTTYEATTNSLGAYKLYVPTGKYTLIVVGKDASTDYKNISTSVNVTAGMMSGPMTDQNATTAWSGGEEKMGLTVDTLNGSGKAITGVANAGAKVSAFTYDDATQKLTFLASGVAGKASASATTGAYKIALLECQPGKKILVRAEDAAGNIYDNTTYKTTSVALNTMTLTADNTDATIVKPIDIAFADSGSTAMTSFLKSKITSVTTTIAGISVTLKPTEQYTIGSNKITINAGVLTPPGDYTIRVTAAGYNEGSITQTIAVSNTAAPTTLTGTFTIKAGGGTTSGAAQFSSVGTAGTGDSLVYLVSSNSTIQNKLGDTLTGFTALTANTDITGLAVATTKYIHVYEISSSNAVVKAKVFTLTASQIKSGTTSTTPPTNGASISDKPGFEYDGIGILNLPSAATGNTYKYIVPDGISYFQDPKVGDNVAGWKAVTNGAELDLGFNAEEAHKKSVYVAEVNASNIIGKVVNLSTANILDYKPATQGTLTGTVTVGPDPFMMGNPDVGNIINGQDRTITITCDGGTAVTVNFSSTIDTKNQLIGCINNVIAVPDGPGVAQYDLSGHIQIISAKSGSSSKVRIGGKDASRFFGTSPTIVDGTNESN